MNTGYLVEASKRGEKNISRNARQMSARIFSFEFQMASPNTVTIKYIDLFSHFTVQLPNREKGE